MTFTHAVSTNNYGPAKIIVATSIANGTHTTLASALAAASSGDTVFLRDSVTENVTLPPGVNIAAWTGGVLNTPTITGKVSMTGAGTSTISGIHLKTNSDYCIAVTGSAASLLSLTDCYIDANNNTAISYTSSVSAKLILNNCRGDLATTGIAYFSHSSTSGQLIFIGGYYQNNGGSSTASTISGAGGGVTFLGVSYFNNVITSTNGSLFQGLNTSFFSALTLSGATDTISNCAISAGTSSAISISAGGALTIDNSVIGTTNTNAITGLGSITFSNLTFSDSSSTINTTTQAATYTDLGKYRATKQPAFLAYLTSSALNVTGDGTTYVIVYSAEQFDVGNDFNTGTGIFTAPVTGKYPLSFVVSLDQLAAGHTSLLIQINTSNLTNIQTFRFNPAPILTSPTIVTGSLLCDMDAADTAKIQVTVSGSTKVVDVVGSTAGGSFFSGYLAC
jgi:hypothetical protein